jgi:hypothetical protein
MDSSAIPYSVAVLLGLLFAAALWAYLALRIDCKQKALDGKAYINRLEHRCADMALQLDDYNTLKTDSEFLKLQYRELDKNLNTVMKRALRYRDERDKADKDLIKKNKMIEEFVEKFGILTEHVDFPDTERS